MLQQRYCKGGVPVLVMGMVCDKDAAAMFEAEVEHGATEHVTMQSGWKKGRHELAT